ncbi:MAG: hypothetical protein H0W13_08095 [Nitrospirales bacterium]|nr:hypothetical protein [Nitrospirales bacterium]
MARQYAQYMGIAIIGIGVLGLLLGEQSLLGLVNIDVMEDIVHLLTGGLMAYVGYAHRDLGVVKNVVGGVGVLYLLVGALGFVAPTLFGLLPHGYSVFDNVLHLTLGILGIAMAWFVGSQAMRPAAQTR